jgi:hypothetical protein
MADLERLLGAWRVVSFEYRFDDGTTSEPFGPDPEGLLVYDETGYMTAQIMRRDRPRIATGDRRRGTRDELHAAVEGYIAYFGTYEVEEATKSVVHRELGDLFPNAVATKQVRYYSFEGDLLVLGVPPVMVAGRRATARVVWRRANSS